MPNIENAKKNKIKPENIMQAQGEVTKCKYAGERSFGFGPMQKTTHFYKIFVKVDGFEKPFVIKVKEKAGWNAGIAQDIKSVGKMFGANKPVNEGDRLCLVYDKIKPKKCFLVDAPEQAPQF
ncbi:MAG: hypothetical protein FWE22_00605 [Firmicutes bacterium]|nr:hypothetical protein [Bacillota bacterium]